MNEPALLTLTASLDWPRLALGQAAAVHVVAELSVPAANTDRQPLSLVLALDCSGSMDGEKLRHVVASVELLLAQLRPTDRLGIVAFSTAARTVLPLGRVDRAATRAALARLEALGGTHVEAGLKRAAELLDGRGAVVLLSDGQPNAGALTRLTLREVTRGLGVSVSTLGYGSDHAEDVLLEIAESGRGAYAYVAAPELCRVELARAVGQHAAVAADGVSLTLEPRRGVTIERVLGAAHVGGFRADCGLEVPLSDFLGGEKRQVAFALKVEPYVEQGSATLARVVLRQRGAAPRELEVRAEVADTLGPVDGTVHGVRLQCAARDVRTRALQHAEARRFDEAKVELERVIAEIRRAPAVSGSAALTELLEQLIDDAELMRQRPSAEAQAAFRRGQQPVLSPRASVAMPASAYGPVPRARLIILEGCSPAEVPVQRDMVLGRTASADLQLSSDGVSRRHTRIVATDGAFYVNDLGSTNGTCLNGARIDCERLRDGDVLQVGSVKLLYRQS